MNSPTILLGHVELEKQGAGAIHICLLESLNSVDFNMDYLRKNLVAFCSDGASVMLDFPNIIIWHCMNHRL